MKTSDTRSSSGLMDGLIIELLSAASGDRKELLKYLLRNTSEFSFVREITRYYFCKYLMYFLETRFFAAPSI